MITENEYKTALAAYKARDPHRWAKYNNPGNENYLLANLVQFQQPASETTIEIVIKSLITKGLFFRVDGGNAATDTQHYLREMTAKIEAPEITGEEVREFAAIPPRVLAAKYWEADGVNEFAIRYRKACKVYGFQIPDKPFSLTAEQYYAASPQERARRCLYDQDYRAAVEELARQGKV
jgi:hypothetical protein